MIWLPDRH